jgi:hypothetical protein
LAQQKVYRENDGVSTIDLGGIWIHNSWKMIFEAFIHNDDMTFFHVAIQGTQKVVVMGCHNFKDEALIKRWRARSSRMKTNRITIESCFHLLLEVVLVFEVIKLTKA